MRWHLNVAQWWHGICCRTFLAGLYEAGNGLYFQCFICHCSLSSSSLLRTFFFSFLTIYSYFTFTAVNLLSSRGSSKDGYLSQSFQLWQMFDSAYDFWGVSELSFSWLALSVILRKKPVNLQHVLVLSWKNRAICLCHIRKWLACLHPVQLACEPSFVIFVMYFCFHFWCLMNFASKIPFSSPAFFISAMLWSLEQLMLKHCKRGWLRTDRNDYIAF